MRSRTILRYLRLAALAVFASPGVVAEVAIAVVLRMTGEARVQAPRVISTSAPARSSALRAAIPRHPCHSAPRLRHRFPGYRARTMFTSNFKSSRCTTTTTIGMGILTNGIRTFTIPFIIPTRPITSDILR